MKLNLLAGTLSAMMLLTPLAIGQDDHKPSPATKSEARTRGRSDDMRRAIEWERAKDRAAARQAAIEARRGGHERSADRTMEDRDTGRKVKDTNAPGARRDR